MILNDPPFYSPSPVYSTYPSITSSYVLPSKYDYEGHTPITQTVGASPVAFIVYNSAINGFNISPSTQSQVGTYTITLTLTDSGGAVGTYNCYIYVNNRAPVWAGSMTTMTIPLGGSQSQEVPSVSDPDPGATVTISDSQSSPICTYTTSTSGSTITLTVTPTSSSELGTHKIYFTASDSFKTSQIYVTVTIYNSAPYFSITL